MTKQILLLSALSIGLTLGSVGCQPSKQIIVHRPDIVLIVYDTVRVDSTGCNGNSRPLTPFMDRLSSDGYQFLSTYATAPWTLPSHASILTGVYPNRHGSRFVPKGYGIDLVGHSIGLLNQDLTTLPKILKNVGYHTVCVGAAPALVPSLGLTRDFDQVDVYGPHRSASNVNSTIRRLMQNFDRDKPLFLLVNYFDAHGPYCRQNLHGGAWLQDIHGPNKRNFYEIIKDKRTMVEHIASGDFNPSAEFFDYTRALYESEIAYVDHEAEQLLYYLSSVRNMQDTIVIVTSDHGELFGEHGLVDHARTLHNELLHVPLVIFRLSDPQPKLIQTPVSLIDLFGTVLDFAGVEAKIDAESSSLVPLMESNDSSIHYPAAEVYRDELWIRHTNKSFDRDLRALYIDQFKVIWDDQNNTEVYSIDENYRRLKNRKSTDPLPGIALKWNQAHPTMLPSIAKLQPEIKVQLEALGYIPSD